MPDIKADRTDVRPLARDCSQNAWPYFEAACLRDTRNPFSQAREARIVSPDRWISCIEASASAQKISLNADAFQDIDIDGNDLLPARSSALVTFTVTSAS